MSEFIAVVSSLPRSAERRSSPRYHVDWNGRYRLDPADAWRGCRVLDVSRDGAALELHDVTLAAGIVGSIELQIVGVSHGAIGVTDTVGLTFNGVIRHHVPLAAHRVSAGVEFNV